MIKLRLIQNRRIKNAAINKFIADSAINVTEATFFARIPLRMLARISMCFESSGVYIRKRNPQGVVRR